MYSAAPLIHSSSSKTLVLYAAKPCPSHDDALLLSPSLNGIPGRHPPPEKRIGLERSIVLQVSTQATHG